MGPEPASWRGPRASSPASGSPDAVLPGEEEPPRSALRRVPLQVNLRAGVTARASARFEQNLPTQRARASARTLPHARHHCHPDHRQSASLAQSAPPGGRAPAGHARPHYRPEATGHDLRTRCGHRSTEPCLNPARPGVGGQTEVKESEHNARKRNRSLRQPPHTLH